MLPLPAPTAARPVRLYTMGLNAAVAGGAPYGGYTIVNGDYDAAKGQTPARGDGQRTTRSSASR